MVLPLRAPRRLTIVALAQAAAALALIFAARQLNAPLDLFDPSPATPSLVFTLDWPLGMGFGLIMLAGLSARLLVGAEYDLPTFQFGALVAEAGALAFFAADNWMTLAGAWLLVEFGLASIPSEGTARRARAMRALTWNLAALTLWLTAGLMVANEGGSLRLAEASVSTTPALLIVAALWIRSGLYPFHGAAPADAQTLAPRLGIPVLLASSALTRVLGQGVPAIDLFNILQIFALVGVGVSALLTLRRGEPVSHLEWIARAAGSLLWLAPFTAPAAAAPALCAWIGLATFCLIVIMDTAYWVRTPARPFPWISLLWAAAALVAAGVPFTPGFFARVGLVAGALAERRPLLGLLVVATTSLALIPLARALIDAPRENEQPLARRDYAAIAFALVPALAVGILPFAPLARFGKSVEDGGAFAYDALIKAPGPMTALFLLIVTLLPVALSLFIARRWGRVAQYFKGLPDSAAEILALERWSRGMENVTGSSANLVRQALGLIEQPPVAWLLFLAIWVALWIFTLEV